MPRTRSPLRVPCALCGRDRIGFLGFHRGKLTLLCLDCCEPEEVGGNVSRQKGLPPRFAQIKTGEA